MDDLKWIAEKLEIGKEMLYFNQKEVIEMGLKEADVLSLTSKRIK